MAFDIRALYRTGQKSRAATRSGLGSGKIPDCRYVVIDDDDDELDELPLFQPSTSTGLTARMADAIEKYLAGKSDKDMRSGPIVRSLENARKQIKRLTK